MTFTLCIRHRRKDIHPVGFYEIIPSTCGARHGLCRPLSVSSHPSECPFPVARHPTNLEYVHRAVLELAFSYCRATASRGIDVWKMGKRLKMDADDQKAVEVDIREHYERPFYDNLGHVIKSKEPLYIFHFKYNGSLD